MKRFRGALYSILFLYLVTQLGFTNEEKSSEPNIIGIEEKIGQMLMVGFWGVNLSDSGVREVLHQAQEGHIGGILFFRRNIESPTQIRELMTAIQLLEVKYPLFLALDQEGGKVQRLKNDNGFKSFLSAYAVAQTMSPWEAGEYYIEMAEQTREGGFNLVLGPVVDLHADPRTGQSCPVIGEKERSFSSDPELVAEYAEAFIRSHRTEGLLTVLKHFPGHGYATLDTHEGVVDITATHASEELEPFDNLVKSKLLDMIMTAHVMNRNLDLTYPATLSPNILKKVLRDEIGYKGIIISDDLRMRAITENFDLKEVVIQAIQAGCDILLFAHNQITDEKSDHTQVISTLEANVNEVHQIIKEAIIQGKLKKSQLDENFRRIVKLKKKLKNNGAVKSLKEKSIEIL